MTTRGGETPTAGRGGDEGRVSGYVFKLIRESIGRTQERLAEELGVSVGTVQAWETGRRPMMAMTAGAFLALHRRLLALRAPADLLDALDSAMEADHFIGHALATRHRDIDPAEHPLASWVITRPFTEMVAWLITGRSPSSVAEAAKKRGRRGPVASGPAIAEDERRHLIEHIQHVADRAGRGTANSLLVRRQAYYLLGFDQDEQTVRWLRDTQVADRRVLPRDHGWSDTWPITRSTASALTRQGDDDRMRAFITERLGDQRGEIANLNYWAYWLGELPGNQVSDGFIGETSPHVWHGDQILRHVADRLHGEVGFVELNVHTLYVLLQLRPELLSRNPALRDELVGKTERLLDESRVSQSSRRELESLRYGISMGQH